MTVAVPPPRRRKCHAHHTWMAACDDCRDAHRPTPTTEKASKA